MAKQHCLQKLSNVITNSMERFFYFWGYSIGRRPVHFICACILMTGLCCLGLINFERETRPERLFIPYGSKLYNTTVWFMSNFPPPFRQEFVIVTADDVLQPESIKQMLKVHQSVSNFNITNGRSWKDVCFKIPIITSIGDDLDLLKGFRNRIIMKREIRNSSFTLSDNDDFFNEDFDDLFSIDENQIFGTISPKTVASQSQHNHQTRQNATTTGVFQGSEFDDFETEFKKGTFRNKITNITDFSIVMPSELYCALVESVPKACWEFSLLELWKYDPEVIGNLTKADILYAVNNVKKSPIFGSPSDYIPLLGGKEFDSEGNVISATALMTMWHVEVNYSNLHTEKEVFDIGLSDPADPDTLDWEAGFLNSVLYKDYGDVTMLVRAWRSVADLGVETVRGSVIPILTGYTCMFVFIVLMLSDFNILDIKILSAIMGVLAVGMAFCSTVGICSVFKVMFGPLHFHSGILLLGLGVDDMFVIVQCWNTMSDADKSKSLPEKMGLTMKHAGVSITITSLTDCIAFSIGSTTMFPCISSLCIYLAVAIVIMFIYQATFFVGWFTIEQRRIAANRNPLLCCLKHKDAKNHWMSPKQILQLGFDSFAPIMKKIYFKVVVFILSISFIGISIWGLCNLEVHYEAEWIFPKHSYLVKFARVLLTQYKSHGQEGIFILCGVNYTSQMPVIEEFINQVKAETNIFAFVEDWYTDFKEFVNTNFNEDVPNRAIPEDQFLTYLGQFLFSPSGALHQKSFRFYEPLVCGKPAPPFQISLMPFQMRGFKGAIEHVPALQRIRAILGEVTFSNPNEWISVWSYIFFLWEVDENVFDDTVRSLLLASLCVFLCTLLALANFSASLLVMSCVFLTLLQVFGFMHLWDLQINILTALSLVLSIGLSVDFAAHIGHAFLTTTGEKNDRASQAFRDIGPAVFNGGVSTLLAYSFLIQAETVGLIIALKMFVLVICFGLFNGLIFLPALLSLVGPAPYPYAVIHINQQLNEPEKHQFIVIDPKLRMEKANGNRNLVPLAQEEETMLNGDAINPD